MLQKVLKNGVSSMRLKERVSAAISFEGKKNELKFVLEMLFSVFGGVLFSQPYLSMSLSPFASSFAASLPPVLSLCASAGASLGFFMFHSGTSAFRYFSITLTSAVSLIICLKAFGMKREDIVRPLCPGLCSFAVNTVFLISQKFSADLLLSTLCETALCAVAVPVFREGLKPLSDKPYLPRKGDRKCIVCFFASLALTAGHMRAFGILGESACFFVFSAAILFSCVLYSFEGCAVCAACCSAVCAMNGEPDFMCAVLPVCGCVCPVFKNRFSKAGFVCAAMFFGAVFGEYTDILPVLPAAAAASVLFCLTSQKIPDFYEKKGSEKIKINKLLMPVRTAEMVQAVENISDCVNTVRKSLQPLIAPDLSAELNIAREKVCADCEIKDSCTNEIRSKNNPCYKKIADALENKEDFSSILPKNFCETCYCCNEMSAAFDRAYFAYCTKLGTMGKMNRIQSLAGNQFKNFGTIIGGMCDSLLDNSSNCSVQSGTAAACAEEFGIKIKDASVSKDSAGHETLSLSFEKPQENFNVSLLTKKLCSDTGYELSFPTLIQNDDIYTLIFKQKEKLGFKIAAAVKPAAGMNVCGDYYRCFKDKSGRQNVILSDGMGTGSRAAIDSAFTCETFCNLLKSGLDEKTAIAAVNCAMMMKSTDESLSTVDLLRIDPILCTAEIFKCGAAPSFILKNGKPQILEPESAPIGILDNVNMSSSALSVSPGDIILSVSDGVCADRCGWIASELKSFRTESASELSKHILQCALDRMIGKRADDMTVVAVMITDEKRE